MKSAQDYLAQANSEVERVDPEDVLDRHGKDGVLFIDVRDSSDIANSGTIAGALRIPRGFIEFAGDEAMPMHNKALSKDAEIYLVCGLGGQAALAGKTMKEMGYTNVTNIGGISQWKEADGPMES